MVAFLRVLPTRWRRERFAYKMAAWEFCLQNGGVSECFSHKMAAWEICLQDDGVSEFYPHDGGVRDLPTRWRQCRVFECFTHKMAAWEICLQDGGVSESFTHKMAATNKT